MYLSLRSLSTYNSTSRNRDMYTQDMSKTLQSSTVGNRWISTNRRVDKWIVVYPHSGILYSNEKEQTTVTCNINESHRHNADCKKPNTKVSITSDSICIKFLKMLTWSTVLGVRTAIPCGGVLRPQGGPWIFLGFWQCFLSHPGCWLHKRVHFVKNSSRYSLTSCVLFCMYTKTLHTVGPLTILHINSNKGWNSTTQHSPTPSIMPDKSVVRCLPKDMYGPLTAARF